MTIPTKIKKDSILEAICEIRFDSNDFPEVILGKFLSIEAWSSYSRNRTAIADIPAPIRNHDEKFKHQALMQLISEDELITVKIGSDVVAYNNLKSYKGWNAYFPEVKTCVGYILENVSSIKVKRIGLRYINALNKQDHLIESINDLNISVNVAESKLSEDFNLNYVKSFSDKHETTVRLSTPRFVRGMPKDSHTLIDIDVYSKSTECLQNQKDIECWIEEAHTFEKEEFFSLIPDKIIEQIREE